MLIDSSTHLKSGIEIASPTKDPKVVLRAICLNRSVPCIIAISPSESDCKSIMPETIMNCHQCEYVPKNQRDSIGEKKLNSKAPTTPDNKAQLRICADISESLPKELRFFATSLTPLCRIPRPVSIDMVSIALAKIPKSPIPVAPSQRATIFVLIIVQIIFIASAPEKIPMTLSILELS